MSCYTRFSPWGICHRATSLMSVRADDPSQAQTLSAWEESLLRLYTHPYLRDGMTMDKFEEYLIIQ